MSDRVERNTHTTGHRLENLLGLSAYDILDVIEEHFRLLVAVRGSVAEHHLGRHLREVPGVSNVRSLDEDGRPDFELTFERTAFRIECKNSLRQRTKGGAARVDFQKTRAAKNDPCSRFYHPDQFEVLAACLHPVTDAWNFQFCSTRDLPRHRDCEARIATNVVVAGITWSTDAREIVQRILENRT